MGKFDAPLTCPSVDFTTNFFLVLTLVVDAVLVVALVLGLAALVSRGAGRAGSFAGDGDRAAGAARWRGSSRS